MAEPHLYAIVVTGFGLIFIAAFLAFMFSILLPLVTSYAFFLLCPRDKKRTSDTLYKADLALLYLTVFHFEYKIYFLRLSLVIKRSGQKEQTLLNAGLKDFCLNIFHSQTLANLG